MSNNIEEDIEILSAMETEITENSYFVTITLEQMRQIQSKANKYDSLVKNIKEKIEEIKIPILLYGGRGNGKTYAKAEKEAKKYILQYLLNIIEKGENDE